MTCRIIFLIIWIATFFSSGYSQTIKVDRSKRAIICLTYDDGLETQLTTVIPQLDSAGLKATFFLNSIQGSARSEVIGQTPEAVLDWTKAAKNGHELANHTLFHPCPENLGWDKTVAVETYTIEKIIKEITTQTALLSLLDPDRKVRSFAFPCNNVFVKGTDYSKIIKDKGLVSFARAGGDSLSVIKDFKKINTMQVPSWHVWTGTTLKELIAFAEKVKKANGMGVYQFHGVGGQVFAISKETHRDFINYLKQHETEYWVTIFSEALEFVARQ